MAAFKGDSIFWIETHKIVPNPFQPRREFDEQKLTELSESIRMYGVLQPLTVTRKEVHNEDGAFRTEYELIAGERRLRASKLAGLEQVPVIIREGDDSEQEKLELAIIENLQREDLNAVDRALAFKQLADMFNLSHALVAKKVGRSREYVSNSIRLLNLPEYMLDSVKTADISEGHARTLLMLNDRPEEQDTLYREILLKKLTVREVERIARKIATDKVRKQKWQGTDPELIEKEKQFTETLGTRVQLTKTDYGGKITIDYFSDEDLDLLLTTLAKNRGEGGQPNVSAVTSAAAALGVAQAAAAANAQSLESLMASTPLAAAAEHAETSVASDATEAAAQPESPTPLVERAEPPAPEEPPATPPETPASPTETAAPAPVVPVTSHPVGTFAPATTHPQPSAPEPIAEPSGSLRDKLAQLFAEPTPAPTMAPVSEEVPVSPATPLVSPVVEVVESMPTPSPAQEVAESTAEAAPAVVPTETESTSPPENAAPTPSQRDASDDDLYGVRHFSI